MEPTPECFICRKHAGEQAAPPGGYLYKDAHFWACHAPAAMAGQGTLLIESRRHILDFAEMTPEEAASYGFCRWPGSIGGQARDASGAGLHAGDAGGPRAFPLAARPSPPDATARGVGYLAEDHACAEDEAVAAAAALRAELA